MRARGGVLLLCGAAARSAVAARATGVVRGREWEWEGTCPGGSAAACIQQCPAADAPPRYACFSECGRQCSGRRIVRHAGRRRDAGGELGAGSAPQTPRKPAESARRVGRLTHAQGPGDGRAAKTRAKARSGNRNASASLISAAARARRLAKPSLCLRFEDLRRRTICEEVEAWERGNVRVRERWAEGQFTCSSARDCELLGRCVGGKCECDAGFTGPACSQLDLRPAADERVGRVWPAAQDRRAYSWGFTAVRDPATQLYHAVVNTGCFNETGPDVDGTFLAHLVSSHPDRGFRFAGIVVSAVSFNPHLVRAPSGEWVLFFRNKRPRGKYDICTGAEDTPPESKLVPYISQDAMVGGSGNVRLADDTGIWVAWARSMAGPWQATAIQIHGVGPAAPVPTRASPGIYTVLRSQRVIAHLGHAQDSKKDVHHVGYVDAETEVKVVKVSSARWLGATWARLESPKGWVKIQDLETGFRWLAPEGKRIVAGYANSTGYNGATGYCSWMAKSNPSPAFVGGRVVLAYRYVIGRSEGINVAWADDFRGPFLSTVPCNYTLTPHWGEDPFIWAKQDGSIHILYHSRRWRKQGSPGLHAFSENGTRWHWTRSVDGTGSYPFRVALRGGGSGVFARRERPELLFDGDGRPRWFYSAVGHPPPDPGSKARKGFQNSVVQQVG